MSFAAGIIQFSKNIGREKSAFSCISCGALPGEVTESFAAADEVSGAEKKLQPAVR